MNEILIPNAVDKVDRNYNYKIDKQGNLIRTKYSLFTDPYSLVTVCIIILGIFYYFSLLNNPLTVKNIDSTCESLGEICGRYLPLKDEWVSKHPGEELNVREIINIKIVIEYNYSKINPDKINFSAFNNE